MTTPFEIRCVRYSGMRLKGPFEQSSVEISVLGNKVANAIPGMASDVQRNEVLVDDNYRNLSEHLFWCRAIQDGEVIIGYNADAVAGVALIRDIKFGASCELNIFGSNNTLGDFAAEVLEYIFKPLPVGLGCLKIRMRMNPGNTQSQQLASAAGFAFVGSLPVEASFHAKPTNMLLVELLNPDLFSTGETINGNGHTGNGTRGTVRPDFVHLGPGDEQPVVASDSDDGSGYDHGDADELLRREFVGAAGVHGASGRESNDGDLEKGRAVGDTGRDVTSATDGDGDGSGREPTRVPKNRRRVKSRKP